MLSSTARSKHALSLRHLGAIEHKCGTANVRVYADADAAHAACRQSSHNLKPTHTAPDSCHVKLER